MFPQSWEDERLTQQEPFEGELWVQAGYLDGGVRFISTAERESADEQIKDKIEDFEVGVFKEINQGILSQIYTGRCL